MYKNCELTQIWVYVLHYQWLTKWRTTGCGCDILRYQSWTVLTSISVKLKTFESGVSWLYLTDTEVSLE